MAEVRLDIPAVAGEEVVQADDVVVLLEENFDQVGTNEAGPAGDEDACVVNFAVHRD